MQAGVQAGVQRILFTSPEIGFALSGEGSSGRIHRTLDGGLTWTQVGAATSPLAELAPALVDEQITIASLSAGRWKQATAVTGPGGSFRLRLRLPRTTQFVAQWDGDGAARGGGTPAVGVRVRR